MVPVLASQAGTATKCKCGQMVDVPSFGELKRTSEPASDSAEQAGATAPNWVGLAVTLVVMVLLFVSGQAAALVLASIACILAGKVWLFITMVGEMGAIALLALITPVLDMLFVFKRFDVAWRPVALQVLGIVFLVLSAASGPPM